jgi:hypothetical protein
VLLPPAPVFRADHRILPAVEQQGLPGHLGRLEAPRLEAVSGDVRGESDRALGEPFGDHASQSLPRRRVGEHDLVAGSPAEQPERLGRVRVGRDEHGELRGERGVDRRRRLTPERVQAGPVFRRDPRHLLVGCRGAQHHNPGHQVGPARGESECHPTTGRPAGHPDRPGAQRVEHLGQVVGGGSNARPGVPDDRGRAAVARPVDCEQCHPAQPGLLR